MASALPSVTADRYASEEGGGEGERGKGIFF